MHTDRIFVTPNVRTILILLYYYHKAKKSVSMHCGSAQSTFMKRLWPLQLLVLSTIDKGLDRSWGFGQNFEVEKLRISGTNLLSPDVFVILETSRLDIGQKMAGLAWFRMGTEFLGKKILSSRPI